MTRPEPGSDRRGGAAPAPDPDSRMARAAGPPAFEKRGSGETAASSARLFARRVTTADKAATTARPAAAPTARPTHCAVLQPLLPEGTGATAVLGPSAVALSTGVDEETGSMLASGAGSAEGVAAVVSAPGKPLSSVPDFPCEPPLPPVFGGGAGGGGEGSQAVGTPNTMSSSMFITYTSPGMIGLKFCEGQTSHLRQTCRACCTSFMTSACQSSAAAVLQAMSAAWLPRKHAHLDCDPAPNQWCTAVSLHGETECPRWLLPAKFIGGNLARVVGGCNGCRPHTDLPVWSQHREVCEHPASIT